jgi:hypothetical protein
MFKALGCHSHRGRRTGSAAAQNTSCREVTGPSFAPFLLRSCSATVIASSGCWRGKSGHLARQAQPCADRRGRRAAARGSVRGGGNGVRSSRHAGGHPCAGRGAAALLPRVHAFPLQNYCLRQALQVGPAGGDPLADCALRVGRATARVLLWRWGGARAAAPLYVTACTQPSAARSSCDGMVRLVYGRLAEQPHLLSLSVPPPLCPRCCPQKP